MNNPEPTICVNVDVTNPGQFFACCGLLELADRLWPGAEGWFDESKFLLICEGTLSNLLHNLVIQTPIEVTRYNGSGLEIKPIIAPIALCCDDSLIPTITLDAWMKIQNLRGVLAIVANRPWNLWSGQQTSNGIWCALRDVLATQLSKIEDTNLQNIFSHRMFQKGRFGFDPGPAWNALDAGFSPNEQGMQVDSSAAVELLAAVGLQRFRPTVSEDLESFVYVTWTQPFSPSVAAAAMCGAVPTSQSLTLRGSIVSRGQYAALGQSHPVHEGEFND